MKCEEIRMKIQAMIIEKTPMPLDVLEHIEGCGACHEYCFLI